jgi:hypothetical protein
MYKRYFAQLTMNFKFVEFVGTLGTITNVKVRNSLKKNQAINRNDYAAGKVFVKHNWKILRLYSST